MIFYFLVYALGCAIAGFWLEKRQKERRHKIENHPGISDQILLLEIYFAVALSWLSVLGLTISWAIGVKNKMQWPDQTV